MNPENVYSTILLGNELDNTLFKTAIRFAESGLPTWFISPQPIEKLPQIQTPDKETLQLITFAYFKDAKDLISNLNGLHLWHKLPQIIIIKGFEHYCKLYEDDYNPSLAGLVSATLLDSANVCYKKNLKNTFLLVPISFPSKEHLKRLQALKDVYFLNVTTASCDKEIFNEYKTFVC